MNIPEVLKRLEHIESYGYELGTDKHWLISTLREALKEREHCNHPGCCCVCGHQGKCPEDGPSHIEGIHD